MCFEPQNIEQGMMNVEVNNKKTFLIRNSLFDIQIILIFIGNIIFYNAF